MPNKSSIAVPDVIEVRTKTLSELTDELEYRGELREQYKNSFFDVIDNFGPEISAVVFNRHRQRDIQLAAEARRTIAAHGANTGHGERKRLNVLLELETILCTEYRNSYFAAINLIGAAIFNFVGDNHRQHDGVVELEASKIDNMIERIKNAAD